MLLKMFFVARVIFNASPGSCYLQVPFLHNRKFLQKDYELEIVNPITFRTRNDLKQILTKL